MRKLLILLLATGSLTGLGALYVGRTGLDLGEAGGRKSGLHVPEEVAANGIVEGVTPVIEIRSELVGTIGTIRYRENETVTKGSLLVELNNATQQQQVAVAEAEVAVAKAELDRLINGERPEKRKALADAEAALKAMFEHAEAKWKRAKGASDKGVGSADQLEEALFTYERLRAEYEKAKSERALVEAPARADEVAAAQAKIRAAQARLSLAHAELSRTRLTAPCNGTILQRFAEPGDMAGPATTHPILVLADLSRLRVRAFIEELDVARVRVGQPAVITADGLPDQKFTGVVTDVLPRMGRRGIETNAPGEYKDIYHREILIDLDDGQSLPVSLRVRARIDARPTARQTKQNLPVPASTLEPMKQPSGDQTQQLWKDQLLPTLTEAVAAPGWVQSILLSSAGGVAADGRPASRSVPIAPSPREKAP